MLGLLDIIVSPILVCQYGLEIYLNITSAVGYLSEHTMPV
jgi:hypothetical protein